MNILSSSSSSSTSTSTATATACLAAMLRRFLCFNSLRTHPTNQIKDINLNSAEFNKIGCLETEEKSEDTVNPEIVARLTELELAPRISFSNTEMKPNPTTRSHSRDYDSLREIESIQVQQRRGKAYLSFHEMPTFFEHEEFFVLSFENLGKNNGLRSKGSRSKRRKAGKRRRRDSERREKVSGEEDKENQESTKMINHKVSQSGILSPSSFNRTSEIVGEAVEQLKFMNMKEDTKGGKEEDVNEEQKGESETECNSENLSPVSVLDFSDPNFHPMEPISGLIS